MTKILIQFLMASWVTVMKNIFASFIFFFTQQKCNNKKVKCIFIFRWKIPRINSSENIHFFQ